MMIRKQDTLEIAADCGVTGDEEALTLYARQHPEDAYGIERVLLFRQSVGEESESLIQATTSAMLGIKAFLRCMKLPPQEI